MEVEPIRNKKKIKALRNYLRGNENTSLGLRDCAIFILGITSALRICDLVRLKIGDVFDDNGNIRESISIIEKKNKKKKVFPLAIDAKTCLEEYLINRSNYNVELCYDTNEALFLSRNDRQIRLKKDIGHLSEKRFYMIIKDAAKEVGITVNVGTHTMRKTWGYHAYLAGMDRYLIQLALSHSSMKITERYLGIEQERKNDVYIGASKAMFN